jgi:predicted nucleic acid-binding protein
MTKSKSNLYWDSCVFLKYINNESESSIIEELMRRAESNQVIIYTSTITIAEVTHAAQERNQSALNSVVESLLQNLFSPIKLVDYSITIGFETRDFIRNAMTHSKKIKPIDGIHLTTASWIDRYIAPLDEFNTYDQAIKALYPSITSIKIVEPHVDQLPLFMPLNP